MAPPKSGPIATPTRTPPKRRRTSASGSKMAFITSLDDWVVKLNAGRDSTSIAGSSPTEAMSVTL